MNEQQAVRGLPLALFLCAALAGAQQAPARTPLDLTPFAGSGPRAELVPILAGDKVLVTSTLRLFAFDAATCEPSWCAGPPDGWDALAPAARDDLFAGLDAPGLWIAPAAGETVAVAALQVPQAKETPKDWQNIEITKSLLERRLFAFELATGKPLWSHAPPPAWDGASGVFAQRMNVIGSPLVVGDRVLVPCASDAAVVDYQVACYELGSGALLWSTHVVDEHVQRNMFGRAVREFAAAPLALDGMRARVIAQTGLGIVAALDLGTGEIRWRAEYHRIPPPRTHSYTTPMPRFVWRMTPPLLAGDLLLVTPRDSADLLALDLKDGRQLWSVSAQALQELDPDTKTLGFVQLIGADSSTVYLGGGKICALRKASGLTSSDPFSVCWAQEQRQPLQQPREICRVRLKGDELLVPVQGEHILALDCRDGHTRSSSVVRALAGFLPTDAALFVLAGDDLCRIER